jgi:class 3 adenylate cyclase/tetratricopeptide (TPR) repeat protein
MQQPSDFVEGERRWAAVLFADMASFTSASEALGAERAYHLVRKIISIASTSIESHGGRVLEYAGDSVLAIFGAPVALENASLKACEAALALQHLVAEEAESFARDFQVAPRFRIGIGGGEVVLGRMGLERKLDLKVAGEPVNLAARLQALAGEGEIWISDGVFQQVEGFIEATSLGRRQVKGLTQPQALYRLDRLREAETKFAGLNRRGTARLMGRVAELERLDAIVRSAASGLRVVSLSGPAGIGKSRLAHELLTAGQFDADVRIVQCGPQSSGVALKPFIDVLRTAAGIGDDDTSGVRRQKLAGLVAQLGIDRPERHPLLGDLMDQSATATSSREDTYQRAADTRDLVCETVAALSRRKPMVLLIEDAHWIDRVSDDLIQATITKYADARLALIVTHRPNYSPAWALSPSVTAITLQPLSRDATDAMIASYLGAEGIPQELAALVNHRSEGNPLFVEETLRFLRAGNHITVAEGGVSFVAPGKGQVLPGNLQHLVMSRVDTLPAEHRALLQFASVFGRHFLSDALERAARSARPIAVALSAFVLQELVEPDRTLGDKGYRFKHALIRDALYESILTDNKRTMHERIARDLEASASDRLGEVAEILAYHYGEDHATDKAVEYLWQSALKSMRLYSVAEADRQLSEANRLISNQPDLVSEERYGEIASAWMRVADQSGNWTRVKHVAAQVLPRLRSADPSTALSHTLTYLALAHVHLRDYRAALELAGEARRLAETLNDPLALAWAKMAHMRIYQETDWKGRAVLSQLADEIAPVAETHNDNHLGLTVRFVLAMSFYSQGLSSKAREAAHELLRFGEARRDRRALGYGSWFLSVISFQEENFQEALQYAEQCLAVAMPNTSDDKLGAMYRAACIMNLGELERGLAALRQCEEDAQKKSDIGLLHAIRFGRGIGELTQGRIADGVRTLKTNSVQVQNTDNILNRHVDKLYRAAMLLAIGLGRGRDAPISKFRIRDLAVVLSVKPFALTWAERLLKECEACPTWQEGGVFQAQVQLGLGRIYAARRNVNLARQHLSKAKEHAEAQGARAIARRADAVLATLDEAA